MFVHVDNTRRAGSRYIRVSSKANTKSLRGKKKPQAMELGATLGGVCLLSEEMGKKSYG